MKLLVCLLLSVSVFAGNHPMTKVIGTNIDLSMKEHSFAGKVNGNLVYGKIHGAGHKFADLIVDSGDKAVMTRIEDQGSFWGGEIVGDTKTTKLQYLNVVRTTAKNAIVISVDGNELEVQIKADGFVNNHFVNPEFSTTIDGKKVSFKVQKGESCWRNSIQLVLNIFGAYTH